MNARWPYVGACAIVFVALLCVGPIRAQTGENKDSPHATFSFINIGEKANQTLSEDFHGYSGNNLKSLPRGERHFASVRFIVGGAMIQLAGNSERKQN